MRPYGSRFRASAPYGRHGRVKGGGLGFGTLNRLGFGVSGFGALRFRVSCVWLKSYFRGLGLRSLGLGFKL